jgi:outer membrane protein assembly factor BamB
VVSVAAPVSAPLSLAGDLVFAGLQNGIVAALDARTGALTWEFRTGRAVRSSPAVVDGVLYVGSSDYRLYAIDAMTGAKRWSFATGGRVTAAPSANDRQVIAVSQDNHVHFIDHRTAKRRFDYKISLANGAAALAGDSVYVSDVSGLIRRIHWDERAWPFEKNIRAVRRWMFRWGMANELPGQKGIVWITQERGESFVGTPAVGPATVYASTASGKMIAYDRATGAERWRVIVAPVALTSPTIIGGQVLVGDANGGVTAIDGDRGVLEWREGVSGSVLDGLGIGGTTLIIATETGGLYAFR